MPSPHFPNAFTTQPLTGKTSCLERADLFRQQCLGNGIMSVPDATAYLPSHHTLLSITAAERVTIGKAKSLPGSSEDLITNPSLVQARKISENSWTVKDGGFGQQSP